MILVLMLLALTRTSLSECVFSNGHELCLLPTLPPVPPEEWEYGDFNNTDYQTQTQRSALPLQSRQRLSEFTFTTRGSVSTSISEALNHCRDVASTMWPSTVVVKVLVKWEEMGSGGILGRSQPTRETLVDNSFLAPIALAEAIGKVDLNSKSTGDEGFDIIMSLNSATKWYTGIDGQPRNGGGGFDLVTVCIHELYHGLFMSSSNIKVFEGTNGFRAVFSRERTFGRFDQFMANHDGCSIVGYSQNETKLGIAFTGNNLWFANGTDKLARLYAPRPFQSGSSLFHLSEVEYGSGGVDDLMTPSIGINYAQHQIGPVLRKLQSAVIDAKFSAGAKVCENIADPKVEDEIVQGGSNGETDGGGSGGFTIKFGDTEISGWIIVGAGVGAVVLIMALVVIIRLICVSTGDSRKRRQHAPRPVAPERVDFRKGGNGGGIV